MAVYFSTWMYEETHAEGGLYAQVGGSTASDNRKLIYWRCVIVFFALAQHHFRNRSDIKLCLFTNARHLPVVNGMDCERYLQSLGVEIIRLEYRWRPNFPSRYWYNQFYIFDILNNVLTRADQDDYVIISDSDCLVVEDLDPMFEVLFRDGYLTMDQIADDPDENVNGITRRNAASLYGLLGGHERPAIAPYYGGEFFGLSVRYIARFLQISRHAFELNNRRAVAGLSHLTEEAHLMSFAMVQMGLTKANADLFIRRIWSHWRLNTRRASDMKLLIWHLPAEKIYGIASVAKLLARRERRLRSKFPPSKAKLASTLGVGQFHLRHFIGHFVLAMIRRVEMLRRDR